MIKFAAVVTAQTRVEVAKQDLIQQDIQMQAAFKEANKIKTLAEAEGYAKKAVMMADGALTQKIDAIVTIHKNWAEAFGKYQGSIVPTYMMGGNSLNGYNAMQGFIDTQTMDAMKQLNIKLNSK